MMLCRFITGLFQRMDIHDLYRGLLLCCTRSVWSANHLVRLSNIQFLLITFDPDYPPFHSHTSQTSLLSLLLAVLTSFTPAYSLGPPSLSSTALQSLSHTAVFPLSLPIKVACFSLALVEDEALKGKEGASANARVVRNDTWIRLFAELKSVLSLRS